MWRNGAQNAGGRPAEDTKNEYFNFHCKMCANPIKKEMYIFVLILF